MLTLVTEMILPQPESLPEKKLANNLLIATPILRDGCFDKSVIFMVEHNKPKGSSGIILNHPTGKSVGDLISSTAFSALSKLPVNHGGPVDADQLFFVIFEWISPRSLSCRIHVSTEQASESLSNDSHIVRAFVGRASWTAGQLSDELEKGVWFTAPITKDTLTSTQDDSLWNSTLENLSCFHHIISLTPENPFRN